MEVFLLINYNFSTRVAMYNVKVQLQKTIIMKFLMQV